MTAKVPRTARQAGDGVARQRGAGDLHCRGQIRCRSAVVNSVPGEIRECASIGVLRDGPWACSRRRLPCPHRDREGGQRGRQSSVTGADHDPRVGTDITARRRPRQSAGRDAEGGPRRFVLDRECQRLARRVGGGGSEAVGRSRGDGGRRLARNRRRRGSPELLWAAETVMLNAGGEAESVPLLTLMTMFAPCLRRRCSASPTERRSWS